MIFLKTKIKNLSRFILKKIIPESRILFDDSIDFDYFKSFLWKTSLGKQVKLYTPYKIGESSIDNYTYIASNSNITNTHIGKFCSIGANLACGWGLHPTNGLSTSPMFYSTLKQNGVTLSNYDKVEERKPILIGNDVYIGANVTIIDGVIIGDGAIIGAGAVVSKDIPPYAIAVGCPIRIIKYRFTEQEIDCLLKIKWWDLGDEDLKNVEIDFFDVRSFISKYELINKL